MSEPWVVERDRYCTRFSGPLEIGECIEVVPCDEAAVKRVALALQAGTITREQIETTLARAAAAVRR